MQTVQNMYMSKIYVFTLLHLRTSHGAGKACRLLFVSTGLKYRHTDRCIFLCVNCENSFTKKYRRFYQNSIGNEGFNLSTVVGSELSVILLFVFGSSNRIDVTPQFLRQWILVRLLAHRLQISECLHVARSLLLVTWKIQTLLTVSQ